MKKIINLILVAVVVAATLTAFTGDVRAWDASVQLSPSKVTEGEKVVFHVIVQNTGSQSMKVTKVEIHFDWMEENYYYRSENVPAVIASGEEHTFSISVPIPKGIPTETHHPFQIRVEASDPGVLSEWGDPYSEQFDSSIYVNEYVPPPDTGNNDNGGDNSGGGSSPSIGLPAVLIAVLLVVAIMWVTKRNRKV